MANDRTFYAYSRFDTEVNEWGRVTKSFHPGDEVTQKDLKVEDDEWNELVKLGVVSVVPYPNTLLGESPNDVFRREDTALAEGTLDEKEAKRVTERQKLQADVANDYQAAATALASAGDHEGSVEAIEEGAEAAGDLRDTADTARNYDNMAMDQLKTLAGKREIEGRSTMNQAQLIDAHKGYDAAQPVE